MPPKYQVICLDGETRHSAPFATLSAAVRWTAEGHKCPPATAHDLVVCGAWSRELAKDNDQLTGGSHFDTVEFRLVGTAPASSRHAHSECSLLSV